MDPSDDRILKWAADLASGLQARLGVIHAISSSEFHLETRFPGTEIRRTLDDAHARISHVLGGSPMPEAEIRVEGGSVPEVVHSVVKDSQADLLIIGRASNRGMMGRLRTLSYALIRESACPVISI